MTYAQWNPSTTYIVSDIVEYNNFIYSATVINLNVTPEPPTATWTKIGGTGVAGQILTTASTTNASNYVPFTVNPSGINTVLTDGNSAFRFNPSTGLLSTTQFNVGTITSSGGIVDNSTGGSTFSSITTGLITNSIVKLLALSVSSALGNLSFQLTTPTATSIPIGSVITISGTSNVLFNGISVTVTGYVGSSNVDTTNPTAIPNGNIGSNGQLAYGSMTSGKIVTPTIDNGTSTLTVGSATSGVAIAIAGGTTGDGNIPFITNTNSTSGTFALKTDSAQHLKYSATSNTLTVGGTTNGAIVLNGTASTFTANGTGATALSVPLGTASLPTITSGVISNGTSDLNIGVGFISGWTTQLSKNLQGFVYPSVAFGSPSLSTGWTFANTGEISFINNWGTNTATIGGFNFYNRTGASASTLLGQFNTNGLSVPTLINNAKLNYNSTFDTLYLGNAVPVGLASGANRNTIVGIGAGTSLTTGENSSYFGTRAGFSTTTGTANTYLGYQTGYYNVTGDNNVCVGFQANLGRTLLSSSNNVYIGMNVAYNNVGDNNVVVGRDAGYGAVTSTYASTTAVGKEAGYSLTTGNNNTMIGKSAGNDCTTGNTNTCVGVNSGFYNKTGTENVCLGVNAGLGDPNQSNSFNTMVGTSAGYSNRTGDLNTCVGRNAGFYNQTGVDNVYIGANAGLGAPSQNNSYNTAVGKNSLYAIETGGYNTAIGNGTGATLKTGQYNTLVGVNAGSALRAGENVCVGVNAGSSLTTGVGNVCIGNGAGDIQATGTYNTYVGYISTTGLNGCNNEIVIGNTTGNGSNTCTIKVVNNGLYLSGYTSAGTLSNTSAGQVTSSSDIRVKSNIVYLPTAGSTETIMGLKPASFDLQFDPYKRYTGFIADDVLTVLPNCVDGKKHKYQYETVTITKQVAQTKRVEVITRVPLEVDGETKESFKDEISYKEEPILDADGNQIFKEEIVKHTSEPKKDADGNIIYKKDADGNLIPRHLGMDYNEITSRLVLAFQEQVKIIAVLQEQVASLMKK